MSQVRATLRLQFNHQFTFADAKKLIPYFSQLGISHIYSSPILKSRDDSMHGYDLVDPNLVNPQLGGEEGLIDFVEELKRYGMGLIVDIVPNHMAVGGNANPWWLDLLKWGRYSDYANFFDVQWQSPNPALRGMLLVPFLRDDYGIVLRDGDIELHFDKNTGEFYFRHGEHRFPLCPLSLHHILFHSQEEAIRQIAHELEFLDQVFNNLALKFMPELKAQAARLEGQLAQLATYPHLLQEIKSLLKLYKVNSHRAQSNPVDSNSRNTTILREPEPNALHELLELQHYRLASWRTAPDDINWRRFFDVNDLGGIRVERQEVFEAVHRKIFELIEQGIIHGLRIDHIDGLANPRAYCRKLRRRILKILPREKLSTDNSGLEPPAFPIYVEKILSGDEQLNKDWQVDGTTGYEFMNSVSLIQHDTQGYLSLASLWSELTDRGPSFRQEIKKARRLVLSSLLAGDLEIVAQEVVAIARRNLMTRDITLNAVRRCLTELVVNFPVYRTYITTMGRHYPQDREYFHQAYEQAKTALVETDWPVLDYLNLWLGGEPLCKLPVGEERQLRKKATARFQQLTSPTAAKAVEDTACYRSAILLSRNDVGFNPHKFSQTVNDFHHQQLTRSQEFSNNLLLTASHDHKRGEDTRARIAVISERADWFREKVHAWFDEATGLRRICDDKPAPSAGDELILYQTLLGTWPLDLDTKNQAEIDHYRDRLVAWQRKAIREAKLESFWSAPNDAYENACEYFLNELLTSPNAQYLRDDIVQAAREIAPAGVINALAQMLLRLTSPGIPDLYQGTEFWDFSLVEPDNRQAVDYAARISALQHQHNYFSDELLDNWQDGRIKQWLIQRTLTLRKQYADLFAYGDYQPLEVEGERANKVVAFLREYKGLCLIVIIPRLTFELLNGNTRPQIAPSEWQNTVVLLPDFVRPYIIKQNLISAIDGRISDGVIYLRDALSRFPCYLSIAEYTEQT